MYDRLEIWLIINSFLSLESPFSSSSIRFAWEILRSSSCRNRSDTEHWRLLARLGSLSIFGAILPCSMRERAWCPTPICSASCSCVSPSCLRLDRMFLPSCLVKVSSAVSIAKNSVFRIVTRIWSGNKGVLVEKTCT